MAASTALSPVRSAGDTEGLSGEEEEPEQVIHDSHSNWLLIQDLKNKIEKMEAFEEDIQKLPLVNKELKDQKQQMEGIGDSLPVLRESHQSGGEPWWHVPEGQEAGGVHEDH